MSIAAMSSLQQRILTALVLAPLAIAGVLMSSSFGFSIGLALVFALGLWEWSRLIGLRQRRMRSVLVLTNLGAMLILAWLFRGRSAELLPLVFVGVGWWLIALLWLRSSSFGGADTAHSLELKWLVGSLVTIPAWAAAWVLHGQGELGPWWTLFVVMLVWAGDVGAYFFGRRFGSVKLAPQISPGKTREGVYGELFVSALFAGAAGWWLLDGNRQAIAALVGLSLVTVIFSVVGDLFESLIKRQSKSKDSGALFPGHGGMLDRLDSMFAALPVFVTGHYWLRL